MPEAEPAGEGSAGAYGVFEGTVKLLKRLKGADGVRVRVKVGGERLTVEPPARVFRLESPVAEPVEVRVRFGDLRQVLSFFELAGFIPHVLEFSEHILALETEYGKLKLRALIAGQID